MRLNTCQLLVINLNCMGQSLSYLKADYALVICVSPLPNIWPKNTLSICFSSENEVGIKNDHSNVGGWGRGAAVIKSEILQGTSRILYIEMKSGYILSCSCQLLCITSPNDYYSNALAHQVNFYYNFYLASFRLWVITFRALGLC